MRNRSSRSSSRAPAARVLAGLLLALGGTTGSTAPVHAAEHTVAIDGVKYEPAALTVSRGETVVWVNKDPFPHTVTVRGAFDSGEIGAGKSWKMTPRKAGTFEYVCTLHPNMKGTLTVK